MQTQTETIQNLGVAKRLTPSSLQTAAGTTPASRKHRDDVPADDKENARLFVSQIVVGALDELKMAYPKTTAWDRGRGRQSAFKGLGQHEQHEALVFFPDRTWQTIGSRDAAVAELVLRDTAESVHANVPKESA